MLSMFREVVHNGKTSLPENIACSLSGMTTILHATSIPRMLLWRSTARSAPRGRRAARARGVLVALLYICTVLFPASIFTFSFFNFMCSNFYLQPFLFLFEFFISNFCVTFISNFSISESFAWIFLCSLIFSCTKILHHDFSLQNLSMSKYSSPNFYVF